MEADKILKIQRELDETKIVLHKTIDSVLARGEKLDNLVAGPSHPSPPPARACRVVIHIVGPRFLTYSGLR